MMEPAVHDVVDVVAMRHRLMTTARPVDVPRLMTMGGVRATVGIRLTDGKGVLFHDAILPLVVEMSVVDVVDVVTVPDRRVTATRSMLMIVILVACGVFAHR